LTEPEHVEGKTKLGRIGIEFYGENNNYKLKIRIGEDLNIQSIETVEQTVNIKTIKRKKIQKKKKHPKKKKKKIPQKFKFKRKILFDSLI
jgi:hypothetical protein